MSEASQKAKGEEKQRRGIPLYADGSEPKINDPAMPPSKTAWHGSNEISFKLLQCVEAIRDISTSLESLAKLDNPNFNKRLVKQVASPLHVLAKGVLDMFNELESNAKHYTLIASPQHKEIINRKKKFTAEVPSDKNSDLRTVRDKIGSHIDKIAVITPEIYWNKVDLLSFLNWIRGCLEQVLYLLSLDAYGWTRDSGHPDVWSLMSVDGTVVDFYMQDGKPVTIIGVTCVKSPKYGFLTEIKNFVVLYNEVARKCEDAELIEISGIDRAEPIQ
jgi:hypothetical protein